MSKPKRLPCCLVAVAGDRRTLCGEKVDDVPVCLTRWASAHRYEHSRCTVCYTTAGLQHMLIPAVLTLFDKDVA